MNTVLSLLAFALSFHVVDSYRVISFKITDSKVFNTQLHSSLTSKDELLSTLDGSDESSYVSPESLNKLYPVNRYYGLVKESYYIDKIDDNKYFINPSGEYLDLTIQSEVAKPLFNMNLNEPIGQKFFQNPILSTAYERGYRENFKVAGFPGIDKEYEEAQSFFVGGNDNGGGKDNKIIMDLSCASGFMMRKFIQSGRYTKVIGADLSPDMLQEARRRCQSESLSKDQVNLIRCDSARLPFASDSLDFIYAGAAMHCWPRVNEVIKECSRVLKPGGKIFASTFLTTLPTTNGCADSTDNVRPIAKLLKSIQSILPSFSSSDNSKPKQTGFQFFESIEVLEKIFTDAGFTNEDINNTGAMLALRKEGRQCIIIKAVK